MQPDQPVTDEEAKTDLLDGLLLGFAGLLAGTIGLWLPQWTAPQSGCCCGVLAAILVPGFDSSLITCTWYARRRTLFRCVLVGLVGLGAFIAGISMGAGQAEEAFREVFSMSPPAGVKELDGQRNYAGVFDGDDILLCFRADESALRQILARRNFVRDDAAVKAYSEGKVTWAGFCTDALVQPSGRYGPWGPNEPMKTPVLYKAPREGGGDSAFPDTCVLWDASTGKAYVHRIGG